MVHPAKSLISNGIMCQDALCVCVCVPIADYVPAWIALGVDAHCVLPMVWMHKHDSEETLHGQGLNPRSVNPPIRDNSTESIRSFQEMPALHNEIQFFTISSKLRCQLSIWLKCKAHKKCVPWCLCACVPVCLCAKMPVLTVPGNAGAPVPNLLVVYRWYSVSQLKGEFLLYKKFSSNPS